LQEKRGEIKNIIAELGGISRPITYYPLKKENLDLTKELNITFNSNDTLCVFTINKHTFENKSMEDMTNLIGKMFIASQSIDVNLADLSRRLYPMRIEQLIIFSINLLDNVKHENFYVEE
jgi:hypothetical protein